MHEECKGLNLGALLITPVQRVPRLGYIHFCTKFPTPLYTIATCSTSFFFFFFKGAVANIKSGLWTSSASSFPMHQLRVSILEDNSV